MNDACAKPWKVMIDPTLTDRYPGDLFAEKADRARAFLDAHLLPEGFVPDPILNSARENVGLEEKYAEALAAIEK